MINVKNGNRETRKGLKGLKTENVGNETGDGYKHEQADIKRLKDKSKKQMFPKSSRKCKALNDNCKKRIIGQSEAVKATNMKHETLNDNGLKREARNTKVVRT